MLRTKPLSRFATYASFGVLFLLVGFYFRDANIVRKQIHKIHDPATAFAKLYPKKETLRSRSLTDGQCRKTFPGLSKEVEDSVARGPFFLKRLTGYTPGIVQGRILDGKLYIISVDDAAQNDVLHRQESILQSLHRAIVTSSEPIPDTVFALNVNDSPIENTWSFSRRNNDDSSAPWAHWLMPHFSTWSWPVPYIGTTDEVLSKIEDIEAAIPWEEKIDKAVWRGTVHFNPAGNPEFRGKLVKVAEGKEWADIASIDWQGDGKAGNLLGLEDFCRYKYIIYTEGVTYSGRLPFHQACGSVIITPPPSYLQHTTHLLQPIFSRSLDLEVAAPYNAVSEDELLDTPVSTTPYTPPHIEQTWAHTYEAHSANVIFVSPDWSDLEATIMWLRKNEETAKGIAYRGRDMMARTGFLSEAAESCYWRSLIQGWASVAIEDDDDIDDGGWGKKLFSGDGAWRWDGTRLGMRYESYVLTGKTGWD